MSDVETLKKDLRRSMERARDATRAIGEMIDALPQGWQFEDHLELARTFVRVVERSGPRRGLMRFER